MSAATTATTRTPSRRRLRRRHLWILPGLAVAIAANRLGETNGIGILALIAFGVAPDVPRLFGHRARPMHDLLHRPVVAAAALAVALAFTAWGVAPVAGMVALVASLVWVSHVIIGWGVGDVPHGTTDRRDV